MSEFIHGGDIYSLQEEVLDFSANINPFGLPKKAKEALEKLNKSWENTALLMGDSWFKTLYRIITPNIKTTIFEVLGYYFINAMVTISAVIFIAGAQTMVITAKIKELQYFGKFNEIFVLSMLILATNLIVKGLLTVLAKKKISVKKEKKEMITKGEAIV